MSLLWGRLNTPGKHPVQVQGCFTSTEIVRTVWDGKPRLSHSSWPPRRLVQVQGWFTSTETVLAVWHGEPRTATSTITQFLTSGGTSLHRCNHLPTPSQPHLLPIATHRTQTNGHSEHEDGPRWPVGGRWTKHGEGGHGQHADHTHAARAEEVDEVTGDDQTGHVAPVHRPQQQALRLLVPHERPVLKQSWKGHYPETELKGAISWNRVQKGDIQKQSWKGQYPETEFKRAISWNRFQRGNILKQKWKGRYPETEVKGAISWNRAETGNILKQWNGPFRFERGNALKKHWTVPQWKGQCPETERGSSTVEWATPNWKGQCPEIALDSSTAEGAMSWNSMGQWHSEMGRSDLKQIGQFHSGMGHSQLKGTKT